MFEKSIEILSRGTVAWSIAAMNGLEPPMEDLMRLHEVREGEDVTDRIIDAIERDDDDAAALASLLGKIIGAQSLLINTLAELTDDILNGRASPEMLMKLVLLRDTLISFTPETVAKPLTMH